MQLSFVDIQLDCSRKASRISLKLEKINALVRKVDKVSYGIIMP